MPQGIKGSHDLFRDVIRGGVTDELKKFVKQGGFTGTRGKNGKLFIPVPEIDLPDFQFGSENEGMGRGEGDEGEVIHRQPAPGEDGDQAGQQAGEGMLVGVDLKEFIEILKEELELPNLKPRPNHTLEDIVIRYNNISKIGPASLIHKRRTMLEALKMSIATGEFQTQLDAGEVPVFSPMQDDFRYRQWNQYKEPNSNAVIFFARDGSGSMSNTKVDLASDLAWWLEQYIRYHYKKVKVKYVWHDTRAKMVGKKTFYGLRHGGGTKCSSAFRLIKKRIDVEFDPSKWNIYIFYFTDGDNWGRDNDLVCQLLKEDLNPNVINLFGMTQILSWGGQDTVKSAIDEHIRSGNLDPEVYRTTEISNNTPTEPSDNWYYWDDSISVEEANLAKMNALKGLLGKRKAST